MAISYGKLLCIVFVSLTLATSSFGCFSFESRCRNGRCYKNAACDGFNDCGDNSDETGSKCASIIQKCGNTSFIYCRNSSKCLPRSRVCDGHNDCGDNYDERYCEGRIIRCYVCISPSSCSSTLIPRYRCDRGVTHCLALKTRVVTGGFEAMVVISRCMPNCHNSSMMFIKEGFQAKCCDTNFCNHPRWTWLTTPIPGKPDGSTSSTNTQAKCYVCNSATSSKDCDNRSVLRTCRTDQPTCFKVDYGLSSNGNRQYAKGCVKSSECNKRSQSLCRTNGTDCNVYCCTGIGCNASSGLRPSSTTFWACVFVYMVIRFL